jgi:hypothetical protein
MICDMLTWHVTHMHEYSSTPSKTALLLQLQPNDNYTATLLNAFYAKCCHSIDTQVFS